MTSPLRKDIQEKNLLFYSPALFDTLVIFACADNFIDELQGENDVLNSRSFESYAGGW